METCCNFSRSVLSVHEPNLSSQSAVEEPLEAADGGPGADELSTAVEDGRYLRHT